MPVMGDGASQREPLTKEEQEAKRKADEAERERLSKLPTTKLPVAGEVEARFG